MISKIKFVIVEFLPKLVGRRFMYSLRYFHQRNKWPNFSNPNDLSEIIIGNILRDYYDRYAALQDKILVREYVKKKGLGDILLKHYYIWNNAGEIKSEYIPEKFVLKTNNGGGGKNIFLCRDKNNFDWDTAIRCLDRALQKHETCEKQYNLINPKIICEELIDTGDNSWPIDYKFTCIHGNIVEILIGTGRENGVKFCTKDINWNPLPNIKSRYLSSAKVEKPVTLADMIRIAKILSQDFPFVRVDLYEYNKKVYFSELTFTPSGGLMYRHTDEIIQKYGRLLKEKKTDYLINTNVE